MRRVCHICGKAYEYPSNDPNVKVGLRRCADCLKIKRNSIIWKCTCGQVFKKREDYYNHRRDMKNAGTPCKDLVYDEPTGKCPFCGKSIGMSKNKIETKRECLVNHRCEGVDAAEAVGITLRSTVEFLQRIEKNNTIKNEAISVDMDKLMQLSWVQSFFEKNEIASKVILTDTCSLIDQLVVSSGEHAVFIFDGKISERSRKFYECLHWHIFELKWTDCILRSEEIEKEIVNELRK